jgi:hypothetical protein
MDFFDYPNEGHTIRVFNGTTELVQYWTDDVPWKASFTKSAKELVKKAGGTHADVHFGGSVYVGDFIKTIKNIK